MYKLLLSCLFIGLLLGKHGKAENLQTKQISLEKVSSFRVSDGDTIKALVRGEIIKIRLLEIDCFETVNNQRAKWQAEVYHKPLNEILQTGKESKKILSALLKQEKDNIYIKLKEKDRFKRHLGRLYIHTADKLLDVNRYMLKNGKCVPYQPMPRSWKPPQK